MDLHREGYSQILSTPGKGDNQIVPPLTPSQVHLVFLYETLFHPFPTHNQAHSKPAARSGALLHDDPPSLFPIQPPLHLPLQWYVVLALPPPPPPPATAQRSPRRPPMSRDALPAIKEPVGIPLTWLLHRSKASSLLRRLPWMASCQARLAAGAEEALGAHGEQNEAGRRLVGDVPRERPAGLPTAPGPQTRGRGGK